MVADCPEYSDLHLRERLVCIWCERPKHELGHNVSPDKEHPRGDHNLYRKLTDANTKAANADLSSRHVQRRLNLFRQIPCSVSDLPKPDLLNTMLIGMLDLI